ncbi:Dor1-like protein [Ascodesmis nigricans]|uniref:Conserved oligomeric Golgi complex subunit 8 n=1 Tax=Ascodesmis nigricans TaxID=341454 RepID=A0A4V3SJ80_9PEZI|nr:Dor1-like protein [Ascodesmis nigricans]
MAAPLGDPLFELLLPHIPPESAPPPTLATSYLTRLTSLPFSALTTTEPASLSSAAHSTNLALQSLASRSHRSIITSANHLSTLPASIASVSDSLKELISAIPDLDNALTSFTTTYTRDSPALKKRAEHRILHANLERILDILHLPTLLQSLIASSNYPAALETIAHAKRLTVLYPDSLAIASIAEETEQLRLTLVSNLLTTLRGALKLPIAMKTVGFLRRANVTDLPALFLVCRFAYIRSLIDALSPLKVLADEPGASGIQAERYLKRWLEVIREQSFGVVSMYRSIFPATSQSSSTSGHIRRSSSMSFAEEIEEPVEQPGPDPVAGFVEALVEMMDETLGRYLPKVTEKSVRESLLTHVLYASGSLGRLGGELAGVLGEGVFESEEEFVKVMTRQRALAGKLEALAATRGVV